MSVNLLAIDQGTTSTRAMLFNAEMRPQGQYQVEFQQFFPKLGWVEHDPEEIWQTTLLTIKQTLVNANCEPDQVTAIGITNQRETTVIWERSTGKPVYKAIVWQDRRTAEYCEKLSNPQVDAMIQNKTGLLLDAYFSATKIKWLLDNIPDIKAKAEKGKLAFGTIDSFLLWRLSGGKCHATDATNASRTLLFNIHTQKWDEELLALFDIPASLLPEVLDSSAFFAKTDKSIVGAEIPITGIAGDQQAALVGQGCFQPGMVKSTYGSGCFLIQNTGDKIIQSKNRLLTTMAYRFQNKSVYALEGSIFNAGTSIKWLRDSLGLIQLSSETEKLAQSLTDNQGVYLVPAFTGLGAPYWQPNARGALVGLARDTGIAQIVRAALEAVCYQTKDLLDAMVEDGADQTISLRVDGGMINNNWLAQFLADILNVKIARPQVTETTALGVAFLASLQVGVYSSLDDMSKLWKQQREFKPTMQSEVRAHYYQGWLRAVGSLIIN